MTKQNFLPIVELSDWQNHTVVRFMAGGYEAAVIPEIGANLIKLRDIKRGLTILREPVDFETFRGRPQIYGLAVLFPPNRIEDGTFTAAGKTYNFPVNEEANHNHLHGFLKDRAWKVGSTHTDGSTASVELIFDADKNTDFYRFLPHEFRCRLLYTLSEEGLNQTFTVENLSNEPMPMGLGYHTAFQVPFHPQSRQENIRMLVSIDRKWELNGRNLPTGNLLPLTAEENVMRESGIPPLGHIISEHYTAQPIKYKGRDFNGGILRDESMGLEVVYEVGEKYKHWMIWNKTADENFICIEPQTWVINAPNVKMEDGITGFRMLVPGEVWSEDSRIYVAEF